MARKTVRQQLKLDINRVRRLAIQNGHKMSPPLFVEVKDHKRLNLFPMRVVSRCIACGNAATVDVEGRKPITAINVSPIHPPACPEDWFTDLP